MQGWTPFYTTIAAVAATLMGLLFVAVSVSAVENLGVGRDTSRRLSGQALQNYLITVMIALVALMPDVSTRSFGFTALSLTAIGAASTAVRVGLMLIKGGRDRRWSSIRRYIASLIGFAMLIFSAVSMALGVEGWRTLFAVSLLVLLGSATMVSWELLLQIAKVEDRS